MRHDQQLSDDRGFPHAGEGNSQFSRRCGSLAAWLHCAETRKGRRLSQRLLEGSGSFEQSDGEGPRVFGCCFGDDGGSSIGGGAGPLVDMRRVCAARGGGRCCGPSMHSTFGRSL